MDFLNFINFKKESLKNRILGQVGTPLILTKNYMIYKLFYRISFTCYKFY